MPCPWCSREIGYLQMGRAHAHCPFCERKAAYAFHLRKVLPGWGITALAAWLLPAAAAPVVLGAGFALSLHRGMYLKKSY
ncbi:hypothetical protein [Paracidovorax wautersii]|uniref:Zinc-ribbon domain-containing protein n=1 Tax=Paracidovorax wautersii TaxID=1177982 RepID=A0ABU1IGR2_9BURK|nr:hypothetical protein [Paracidovorax wautersii]MDR6216320.1 hypothetical protein [Paracidovorax wautersii]